AVLTADSGDTEKVSEIIDECVRMGIPVLPPDVNESFAKFTVIKGENNQDKIRFGLESIKNVGVNIVQAIIDARERNNKFSSITDFVERVRHKDLNKKSLESLIKCGAMDSLGERGLLLSNVETILEYSRDCQKQSSGNQNSLFSLTPGVLVSQIRLKPCEPAQKKDKLSWEKELLGLYVSEHPLHSYKEKIPKNATPLRNLAELRDGQRVFVYGLVSTVKKNLTKTGSPMLFVTLEDLSGKNEVIVFPGILEKTYAVWQPEKIISVKGKLSAKDGAMKILCDEAAEL
ncbi:DNA polymerase III subunit alpha, partial [Patescibacteria group bacterium]|nr:DNA polymerase III subunit alpha [Patescibacteria group bacterium]